MKILPIGGYFSKDKSGFLMNPASWNQVSEKYQQFIYKFIENIPASVKEWLDSIYIRGSLPRDVDDKFVSDIDLFALTKKKEMR